jgi:hypothetical protein
MTILQNIETLKNDHNISIVYITHDSGFELQAA